MLAAKLPDVSPEPLQEASPLGSWHGHLIRFDRRQCVMFMHDDTRYALFLPGLRKEHFAVLGARWFRQLYTATLAVLGCPNRQIRKVELALGPVRYDTSTDRSVQSSMRVAKQDLEAWVYDVPNVMALDPLAAAAWLNDRPARMYGKLVWPGPAMRERVEALQLPSYERLPLAARVDPSLYELLALSDTLRVGAAKERELARTELRKRLGMTTGQEERRVTGKKDRLVIGGTIVVSRADLQALAQRHHIRRLVLFGSAARGELRPESDIDLLVEFETGEAPSLGGMVNIQDAFTTLFGGRKVGVATPSVLNNPYRRRAIEKDMEELYAA